MFILNLNLNNHEFFSNKKLFSDVDRQKLKISFYVGCSYSDDDSNTLTLDFDNHISLYLEEVFSRKTTSFYKYQSTYTRIFDNICTRLKRRINNFFLKNYNFENLDSLFGKTLNVDIKVSLPKISLNVRRLWKSYKKIYMRKSSRLKESLNEFNEDEVIFELMELRREYDKNVVSILADEILIDMSFEPITGRIICPDQRKGSYV